MADQNDTGLWGEKLAAEYLCARGWEVVERRWRDGSPGGLRTDIDVIAQSPDGVYHFVEVKTRTGTVSERGDFSPETAVTPAKMRRMVLAAERYMALLGLDGEIAVDLIAVVVDEVGGDSEIRYYSDVAR